MRKTNLGLGIAAGLLLTACGGGGGGGGGGGLPGVDPNVAWARDAIGTGTFSAGVRVGPHGPNRISVVGLFDGQVTLGAGTPTQASFTCDGLYNAVVARYDDAGNLVWARKIGSTNEMYVEAVLTLGDGSCMVTGWF